MPNTIDFTSYSEISLWCQCRQKWFWHYDRCIEPRRMQALPTQGTIGHLALAALLKGENVADAVNQFYLDTLQAGELFEGEDDTLHTLCAKMLAVVLRYGQHYPDEPSAWQSVATESQFEIPIASVRTRLRGTWDALITSENGTYWLMETKFVDKQFRTREMLDLDMQTGIYQWAAQRVGIPVKGTIYNQVLAHLPNQPKINKDGSVSKADCLTDWPTYLQAVIDAGQNPANYEDMREKLAEKKFYQRDYLIRSPTEIGRYARNMERAVWDMRRTQRRNIYRCDDRIRCQICPFQQLCVETLKGGDVEFLIEHDYQPKKDRYATPVEEVTT